MRVCCGSRRGRCVLFTNILDSLTVPCLVYNTAMYTVYGRCGQYGRCMVHTLASAAGAWFIRTLELSSDYSTQLTQLNEHLWTQVIKHLNVHIYLVTVSYQYYNQLISRTDLSPTRWMWTLRCFTPASIHAR